MIKEAGLQGAFLDLDTVDRGDLDLSGLADALTHWQLHRSTTPDQVVTRLAGRAVVVINKVKLDRAILNQCPELRLICVAATGVNNVDLVAAGELGIDVCNVGGYSTASVVQHVFAMLLALSTSMPRYQAAVARGDWCRSEKFCLLDYPIDEIAGMTLGIVGYGTLGQAVAHVAEAFGMKVLIAQRPGQQPVSGRLTLNALLPQVDVLSLHCPLTPETHGLIDEKALALLKPKAILLNTARGGIVDEQALAEALRSGHLAGAGIDVLATEPPSPDAPLLAQGIPNLILTPHTAWASRQARQRLIDELVLNIQGYCTGAVRNRIT